MAGKRNLREFRANLAPGQPDLGKSGEMSKQSFIKTPFELPSADDDGFVVDTWLSFGAPLIETVTGVAQPASAPTAPDIVSLGLVEDAKFDFGQHDSGSSSGGAFAAAADAVVNPVAPAGPVPQSDAGKVAIPQNGPEPIPPQHGSTSDGTAAAAHDVPAATAPAADPAFVFHAGFGQVVISDFVPGTTVIQFDKDVFANFADVQSHLIQAGPDAAISRDYADFIIIKNVNAASLHDSDFLFV